MLKQPRAEEGPGPAVFVLWREMTSAFKGQAGSRRAIAQSLPLLPASAGGAESTQGLGRTRAGLRPQSGLPPAPSPEKDQADLPQSSFLGCIRRKDGWMPPRKASTAAPKHTRPRCRRYSAASRRAKATRRLSKHNEPRKREQEPGGRL